MMVIMMMTTTAATINTPITSTTSLPGVPNSESQIRSYFDVARAHFLSLGHANVSIAFQNHGGKGTTYILKLS